jgi:hypothetical protein
MELQHIVNGEDMDSVRNKINAMIDIYNKTFPVTKSYLDLENKPAIDGKELMPESMMKDYKIPIESLPDELDLKKLFIDSAKENAEIIARMVAQEEIEKEKQLSSIPVATGFADDNWKILVYIQQKDNSLKLFQTTMKEITDKAVWATTKFISEKEPIPNTGTPGIEE